MSSLPALPVIYIIGSDTHLTRELLEALRLLDRVRVEARILGVPAEPADTAEMLVDKIALRVREWDPTPEPTWFPETRVRMGKGEKRRLKKTRGW